MPDCPYAGLSPANLVLCERRLCGWVTEPANTWTNLGFLVAAAVIFRWARRDGWTSAAWLGWIALGTGLASAAFHATSTLVGQLVDQGVMFLETSLFVVLDLRRLGVRLPASGAIIYWSLVGVSAAALVSLPASGVALFAVHAVAFVVLEVACLWRRLRPTPLPLFAAWGTFLVGYAFWWLDASGRWCDPDNHVLGAHGLWHLLGAASFPLYYRYFAADGDVLRAR